MTIENLADTMNDRFDAVDERFLSIDGCFSSMDERFDKTDRELSRLGVIQEAMDDKIVGLAEGHKMLFDKIVSVDHKVDSIEARLQGAGINLLS